MTIETTSRKIVEQTMGERSCSTLIRSFKKYMDGEAEKLMRPDPHASDLDQRAMKLREVRYRALHDVFMKVCADAKG